MIGWSKRDPLGRPLHPWEEITLDQLSPQAQKLIAKMARTAANDFFGEMQETFWEAVRTDLGKQIQEAVNAPQTPRQGAPGPDYGISCSFCNNAYDGTAEMRPWESGWAHVYPESVDRYGCPGIYETPATFSTISIDDMPPLLDTLPEQKTESPE